VSIAREELRGYEEASLAFIDDDGYPASIPVEPSFEDESIRLRLPAGVDAERIAGKRVNLVLNHITPLPTGGYTERRYVAMRGAASLRDDQVEFRPEARYGWDERRVPFPEYVEISTPRARGYLSRIGKELGRTFRPSISGAMTLFRATRLPFLMATAVPVSVGAAVAAYHGFFNLFLFLLTLIGASLIHIGLNMANDYYDVLLGADQLNKNPTPFSGGSRVAIYGLMTQGEVIRLSSLFYAAGGAIGLYLALTRGFIEIMTLLAIGVAISYFYTAPPLKLAYRGVGEAMVGLGFGPIVVLGSYFVQAQRLALEPLLASIPIGILIMLILYVNEIPDAPFDKAAGKLQLVTRLSREAALRLLRLLLFLVYAWVVGMVVLGAAPVTALLALLTIPMARSTYRGVEATYGNAYAMMPSLSSNIKLTILTGLLIAVGYAVASVLSALGIPL